MVGLLLVVGLAGCAPGAPVDSGVPSVLPSASADAGVLPVGTRPLPVAGEAFSPVDFVPPLRLTVPSGWVSEHRGDDAFDLVRGPVTVTFVTPPEATSAEALAVLRDRTGTTGTVRGVVGAVGATGFDVVGGSGLLVESPAGTVTVRRTPGQRSRVLGLDLDDTPLLVVLTAPDSAFARALPDIDALLAGVTQG